jgi:adenylosuccinate synthase
MKPAPRKRVVLLSGFVGAGKSTLAQQLVERCGAELVKTRELLVQKNPKIKLERKALQAEGERSDRATGGKWLVDTLRACRPTWFTDSAPGLVVIDSVRILAQIDSLRKAFGNRVVHVHLAANDTTLRARFVSRRSKFQDVSSYRELRRSATERGVAGLEEKADVVIRTDRNTKDDVFVRAIARIGLLSKLCTPLVDIVVGGQYGSEGKGNICSHLAPEYEWLVRVGSVNAGHQVYLDPIYNFRQLPSGTLHNDKADIIIGPGAQIRLDVLLREIAECKVQYGRLSIDPQAMIIEQSDVDWERKSAKLQQIATTAQGVGYAASRRILRGSDVRLAKTAPELKPYIRPTVELLERAFLREQRVLLEGTQGTALSLYHGHYPHVTSRDTTVSGVMAEAGIGPRMVRRVIMVCRSLPIRVENPKSGGGTSGYMAQEISYKILSKRSGIGEKELREAEKTSTTKRQRRLGEFDWVQLRNSALLNTPTDIALTHVDYLVPQNARARRFEQLHEDTINIIEEIERVSAAPVSLISTRFHWRCIIDRRQW